MKFNAQRFWKIMGIFAVLDLLALMCGCSTAWTQEASNIIALLVPAIQSALAILAAFGLGISPSVLTAVNKWATDAESGLAQVKSLIEQYNAAEATAQPGILTEIQTLLGVISSNLAAILPTIQVTDPSTQAKILAVIEAISSEISALLNLVPAIQGQVTSTEELKALMGALKSPKQFKEAYNKAAGVFGESYQI